MKTKANLAALSLMVSLFSTQLANAQGSATHGGDTCEERIRDIAADVSTWVGAGGPGALDFQQSLTLGEYTGKMLSVTLPMIGKETHSTLVECVSGLVQVNGIEKVCEWHDREGRHQISCNRHAFLTLNQADQYRLVHHELAGIAQIETSLGAISDYFLSDQITSSLEPQMVLRLVVKGQVKRSEVIKSMQLIADHMAKVTQQFFAPEKEDKLGYEDFLKDNQSGMMRIFPSLSRWVPNNTMNGYGAYYSFTRKTNDYGLGSDLQFTKGDTGAPVFTVGFAGADYGFIGDIGKVDLRDLSLNHAAVQAVLNYKAPNHLPIAAWRAEANKWEIRNSTRGSVIGNVRFVNTVQAVVGHTYVERSITDQDIAVAFQVLRVEPADRSLIIVWKILKKFESPSIAD